MNREIKLTKELLVSNRSGIHARVGTLLAKKAIEFNAEIKISKGNYVADCRSVLDLLSLGAFQGDVVHVEAVGVDAQSALDAVADLFYNKFNEDLA